MNQQSKEDRWLPHKIYSLFILAEARIGRYQLSKRLGISLSQARTLLKSLKDKKFVMMSENRKSHQLTERGEIYLSEMKKILHINFKHIYLGKKYTIATQDALLCINGDFITNVNTVTLRDNAVKFGAEGCTVFYKSQDSNYYLLDTYFPPLPSIMINNKVILSKLESKISKLEWKSMLIIVGTSNYKPNSFIGALGALLSLNIELFQILSQS